MTLDDLQKAAEANSSGKGLPPVHMWHPEYEAKMDMVIRRDGSWWHEGGEITRAPLVKLFSTILRKDEDGKTYLVTPAEKLEITVERAPFVAVRVDAEGEGKARRLFFTTNVGDVAEAGSERPIRVETDPVSGEPAPYVLVRGRLEAMLSRPVFYELVEMAAERGGKLGVWASGEFFPLGDVPA